MEFQFVERGLMDNWKYPRTMVKGFDERFAMIWCEVRSPTVLFSGEAMVSQSFIEQSILSLLTLLATVSKH